ncbi:MAG TPA: hypothetical protein VGL15_15965 [Vicinamibacteria bacterium]
MASSVSRLAFAAALAAVTGGSPEAQLDAGYFRRYLGQEPEGNAPTLAHAHWRPGTAVAGQGRRDEARSELQTALRLKPDLDEAKKELAALR